MHFRANAELMPREIAGEFLLIPVGSMALKLHGMLALSESGKFLWDRLQNSCTEDELTEALLKEYETDGETARKDVQVFLEKMSQLGVLERIEDEVGT